MKETAAIGLMSGSSLDGLDIALVRFQEKEDKYQFQILQAETLPYPEYWTEQLSEAFHKQPEDLLRTATPSSTVPRSITRFKLATDKS